MESVALQKLAQAFKLKQVIQGTLGEKAYLSMRNQALKAEQNARKLRRAIERRNLTRRSPNFEGAVKHNGMLWAESRELMPEGVRRRNFEFVSSALTHNDVLWWLVDGRPGARFTIAISRADADRGLHALSKATKTGPTYITLPVPLAVVAPLELATELPIFTEADVWRIAMPVATEESSLRYGFVQGCDVELWETPEDGVTEVVAPRENRAARIMSQKDFTLEDAQVMGFSVKRPSVLGRHMLDDIDFPIDAVYTWVDGDDPDWRASKQQYEAQAAGVEYHPESNHVARFRSRDELRYSLRSLETYAPWIRNIYLVTNGQVPRWLDLSNPRIKLVSHKDIYPDTGILPTFNSNSIISRLHHIDGLSENYIYINDDVFFGRPVTAENFFYANGVARVSVSNNRRPFGEATALDGPHFNLTRNIRTLLENEFGITISRAIKHTPHPQIRSVHFEMEERFRSVYEDTWASRFRHHSDIVADQLHHYYAQIIGKATLTRMPYSYINVLDDTYRGVMANVLRRRDQSAFCLNDAPVEGAVPMDDGEVGTFLRQYFPTKSSFELEDNKGRA